MKFSAVIHVPERTKRNHETKVWEVVTPAQAVRVFIEINEESLARQLGGKAWTNKSKKSAAMSGAVRCIEVRPAS